MYTVKQMNQQEAELITRWEYPEPYDFYNLPNDQEDLLEILSPEERQDTYYSVYYQNKLVGMYEFRYEGTTCVYGLGLAPQLTGHGHGKDFVLFGIEFMKQLHPEINKIELSVVAFNKRAQITYERCGFIVTGSKLMMSYGTLHEFITMEKMV